jgi:ABC-type amino acid transport system permease subunit
VLKNSALIGPAISLPELTYQAYSLESVSFRATEIYFTLAVIYLAVVWVLSGLIRGLEAWLALPEARRVRTRRVQRLREAV